MLNPLSFFSKFIKTGNQKELDRIAKIVEKINVLEENFKNLADIDFPNKIRSGTSSVISKKELKVA